MFSRQRKRKRRLNSARQGGGSRGGSPTGSQGVVAAYNRRKPMPPRFRFSENEPRPAAAGVRGQSPCNKSGSPTGSRGVVAAYNRRKPMPPRFRFSENEPRPAAAGAWGQSPRNKKCGPGDSNPHALRHQILSLERLPIPPGPQIKMKNDRSSPTADEQQPAENYSAAGCLLMVKVTWLPESL